MSSAAYAQRTATLGAPWGQVRYGPLRGGGVSGAHPDLARLLTGLVDAYPARWQPVVRCEVARTGFLLELVVARSRTSLLEVGGGSGLFALGAASLGIETWLARDPSVGLLPQLDLQVLAAGAAHRLHVLSSTATGLGNRAPEGSFDVVVCASDVARWRRAPRAVLMEAFRALKPGGTLLLAAQNGASAGRRLRTLAGRGAGMSFEDWYYPEEASGPVREPVLEDLRRMTRELGFGQVSVHGRCFAGRRSGRAGRALAKVADRLLRPLPTLCSELALVAERP